MWDTNGEVKVGGLSSRQAKQSDLHLDWIMFHRICKMFHDAKKKQDEYFNELTEPFKEKVENEVLGPKAVRLKLPKGSVADMDNPDQVDHQDDSAEVDGTEKGNDVMMADQTTQEPNGNDVATADKTTQEPNGTSNGTIEDQPMINQPTKHQHIIVCDGEESKELELLLQEIMKVPDDLKDIQPRPDQQWNVDEIGIDPNGKWHCIVCTYKWCPTEKVWKTQTGERAPFWCTILFFTHADGQCFIAPTIVHQAAKFTADLLYGIPDNWVIHATPSGYMDHHGWYKMIDNFTKLSRASKGNPQFLFFDGHDSHWDADALDLMVQ